jgi:hypothetical protein
MSRTDDLDVWPDPPPGLRWLSMALRCPDCGNTPLDPVFNEVSGRWGLPWPHPDNCPSRYVGGEIKPPTLRSVKRQEAVA